MSVMRNKSNSNKKSNVIKSGKKMRTKKNSDKGSINFKKQKKKTNLIKLSSVMNNYADDANDKEIIKRFKSTITSSVAEDISKTSLLTILKKPEDAKMSDFSESIQPYIKHYIFMVNRSLNRKTNKK